MAFDAGGNLYVTNFGDITAGAIIKVSNTGKVLAQYSSQNYLAPESAVTDGYSRLYVGQAGNGAGNIGPNSIHMLDFAGNELTELTVAEDRRGADWIDLASDRCTMRYTSEGSLVKRFNVCTGVQLSDFAGGLHGAYAIRILADGGAVVADTDRIVRLNASGAVTQTYDAPGEDQWFALDLTPDGASFWAGNVTTANVYKFDLASGAIVASFHAGNGQVGGIGVYNPARFAFAGPPEPQTYGNGPGAHGTDPTNRTSEPVNTATGNYMSSALDAHLPGRGLALDFARSYNSLDTAIGVLGQGWTHSFAGRLVTNGDGSVTVAVEGGARLSFTSGGIGGFVSPPGVTDVLTTRGGGYDLRRRDGLLSHFDATGNLIAESDRNGNALTLTYTTGQLTKVSDPVGRSIDLTYDPSGRLASLAVPPGRTVRYTYDVNGRLATVTDLGGGITTYGYDSAGRLASITDANSHQVVRNTYGSDGRVSQQRDPRDKLTTFTWDPATETATMTDPRGGVWTDVYRGGVLVETSDPLGHATGYLFDPTYHLAAIVDRNGGTTSFEYDSAGNLTRRSVPAALRYSAELFTYNTANDILTSTDRRGNVTTSTYDGAGNVLTKTGPAPVSAQTTYTYDPTGTGLVFSVKDPRGKTTSLAYDAQANLSRITSPLGEKTTFTSDAAGRRLTTVEARGNATGADPTQYTTTTTYNGLDEALTVTDPLTHVTTATYDLVGDRLTSRDANNHTTTWTYDAANHVDSVTNADSKTTSYSYDDAANLASVTNARLNQTTFGYDLAGRRTSETRPLGRVWSYGYDANGNRTSIIDANGNGTPTAGDGTTTTTYDALNRVKTVTYSDATPAVSFTYDGNSNRTQMTDGATSTYTYDVNDRLTRVVRGTTQLDHTYDAAGNRLTRSPLGGSTVTYTYDDDSRMATMVVGTATTAYGYDLASHPVSTTLPSGNGYIETRTYDRAGRLTEVKNAKGATTLSRNTFTLDSVGNPLASITAGGTITYAYDVVDRLTQACYATACAAPGDNFRRYTYDAMGNRLTEVRDTGTTTYTYDTLDQLTATTGPAGNVAYVFDRNGNDTTAGAKTFSYDLANRTKTAVVAGTTYTNTYDGDGYRVQTSTGTQANKKTNFQWDSSVAVPLLILETDGNGSLLREYRYGNRLVSLQAGNNSYYYALDGLGSVSNMTSSTGATLWTETYQPFGELKTEVKSSNQAPVNFMKFAGEYLDPTALYHLRARQYDPTTGRFLATDPLRPGVGEPAQSPYVYADDRPTSRIDPTGRDSNGACVSINIGGGPGQLVADLCVVKTTSGQGGVTLALGGGAGANLDIIGGVGYQHSNADTVSDLGNYFGEFGGSATLGLGGYANVFGGAGRCQGKIVNGFNAGATAGVGASVSANGTYTFAFQLTGPPDPPCYARPLK